MARRCDTAELKNFSDVSRLGNVALKRCCDQLKSTVERPGKKAMVDIVCNELNISLSGETGNTGDRQAWLKYLQKLPNWTKSMSGFPDMDIHNVKSFLVGSGVDVDKVKKYKTLRSWELKQDVHSIRFVKYFYSAFVVLLRL